MFIHRVQSAHVDEKLLLNTFSFAVDYWRVHGRRIIGKIKRVAKTPITQQLLHTHDEHFVSVKVIQEFSR